MGNLDTKYSFWTLISQYKIEIPIMQRDYAQGRTDERTTTIREEFVETLYQAVKNDRNVDFDFVYGTVKEQKLLPLDGQQRLTTLFLLHWYAAVKEGRLTDEVSEILGRFTYSTRISSREFCRALVNFEMKPEKNKSVSEVIRDSNWYFRTWNQDPTIKAMLVMTDTLHEKFIDEQDIFEKLTRDIKNNPPITFSFLSMEDYSLTDDLYIKMNARGKILSDFENFKAKFMQHLKDKGFDYKHFENSIENEWTDLLWEYRSENHTIDDAFMNLFTFITEMIYTEKAEAVDMVSPFRKNRIRLLIKTYDSEEKVELLYEMLDLWGQKQEMEAAMEEIFCTEYKDGKTRLFDGKCNLAEQCIKGENISLPNKVILYLVMRRLAYYKQQGRKDTGTADFARVVRNLIIRVRSLKSFNYQTDFRYGRNAVPFVQFVRDKLLTADDVYKVLPSLTGISAVSEENLKDEIEKAKLINTNAENKIKIHRLEDMDIFRGCIHNIMKLLKEEQEETGKKAEAAGKEEVEESAEIEKSTETGKVKVSEKMDLAECFAEIFSLQNTSSAARALLSIGDYGIRLGGSVLGDRYYYGSKDNWHTILTTRKNRQYSEIFCKLIRQYRAAKAKKPSGKLKEIAVHNSSGLSSGQWRYYFVKYPAVLEHDNLLFAFENHREKSIKMHRMNGKTLNGYHIVPLYLEIARQLGTEKCDAQCCWGINSEEGAVVLNCGVDITINDSGEFEVFMNGHDEKKIDKVLKKYNQMDANGKDYVELGVILCKLLDEALK